MKCTGICGRELEQNERNFGKVKISQLWRNQCKSCINVKVLNNAKTKNIIEKDNLLYRICCTCKKQKELNNNNFTWYNKKEKAYQLRCKDCNNLKILIRCKTNNIIKLFGILFRKCTKCNEQKKLNNNNFAWHNENEKAYQLTCKSCVKTIDKKRNSVPKNMEIAKQRVKKWRENPNNKKRKNENSKKYRQENIKAKIHHNLSNAILRALKLKNKIKNGSMLDNLPYSLNKLKKHIEKYFKLPENYWMNWNNWGIYKIKTWDDNDSSTWTWQLDHIIPESDFNYTSMDNDEFKKCWGLDNLRPLKAKNNIIDGARRTRHKSNNI